MNKHLYTTFKKLNDTERSALVYKFKDSPVVLKFIDFIHTSANPNFKSTVAIDAIYGAEKNKTAFPVLENRYFKLRKKILDELENSKGGDSKIIHTEEELKFYKAKEFIASENRETGYKLLLDLEKECWEKNIFELLPSIIDQIVFCNQSYNRMGNNAGLYKRYEKAIELLSDMNRCTMTARKIYEINFTKGILYAKKELATLKQLSVKNKTYPRFSLCYQHVSAYYKLGSKDYVNDMQVISRHLTEYKRLQSKHALVPIMSYRVNYVQLQHMHFNQMMVSFHFNRCDFEETYITLREQWKLISEENSIFKQYKTESFYYNMFTAQCMTQRYSEANETVNEYIQHLKNNHQTDKLPMANALKARILSEIYPQTMKMDLHFLMSQMDEYIKTVRKGDNMQVPLDQSLVLKMKLWLISGSPEKAVVLMKDPIVIEFLRSVHLLEVFQSLINITQEDSSQKNKKLVELSKTVQSIKHKASSPAEYMQIFWLQNYLKRLIG